MDLLQKCRMPPEFLLGVDKLTAFVQPQLNSHRQGQQKLSGRTALPQQCLQIGKCHKDHLMHSICRHVWKYTKGILCKSLVRCCPEIFECLLHAFYNVPQKFVKHFRMFVVFELVVYNFYIVSSLELSEIHNTYAIFTKSQLIFLTKYFLRSD